MTKNDDFTTAVENLEDFFEAILEFHKKYARRAIMFMKFHILETMRHLRHQ